MTSRRSFVRNLSLLGLSLNWKRSLAGLQAQFNTSAGIDWEAVRHQFPVSQWDMIHFNSGSAGVLSIPVRDYLLDLITYVNSKAPYEVWSEWQPIKKENLARLANLLSCSSQSLQVVRNTTEALNMIIYGIPLKEGDEVIISEHEYPFAKNAWLNRQQRDRIQVRSIEFDLPGSNQQIIDAYANAIGAATKVLHITHMTHRQGRILPVKEIVQLAHSRGVEVVVDGAHVVGHIPVDLGELECDYFASSLHKWLNAPHGTGLLYVHPDKIARPHESSFVQPGCLPDHKQIRAYRHKMLGQ